MSLYSDLNRKDAKTRSRVLDFDAVLHSVENILSTPPRQRLFRPEGVDLESLLFELDVATAWKVKNLIFKALTEDTRITMLYNQTQVIPDPDNHVFKVIARFKVKGFEDRVLTKVGQVAVPR